MRPVHFGPYRTGEIDSTLITSLSKSPVTATRKNGFLPVCRTSSAAFAFPAESSFKLVEPSWPTMAKDFVFAFAVQYGSRNYGHD